MILNFSGSQQLLDIALRSAKKKSLQAKAGAGFDKFRQVRVEEDSMLRESADFLIERLHQAVKEFPDFSRLNPFIKELAESSLDLAALKKALAHLSESERLIKKIKYEHLKKLHSVERMQKWQLVSLERKKFIGRAASIVRKLQPSIEVLKAGERTMRQFPKISEECFTGVLAGFPNAGKTTMLKRLTGSEPLIAHYAFTTKTIKQGFFEEEFCKVQVLDTPGLLDRLPEERNPAEKKAASALRHAASLVLFIADVSKNAAYDAEDNGSLLEKLLKEFEGKKFFMILNKCDSPNNELKERMLEKAREKGIKAFEEGNGIKSSLRQELGKEAMENLKKRIAV